MGLLAVDFASTYILPAPNAPSSSVVLSGFVACCNSDLMLVFMFMFMFMFMRLYGGEEG